MLMQTANPAGVEPRGTCVQLQLFSDDYFEHQDSCQALEQESYKGAYPLQRFLYARKPISPEWSVFCQDLITPKFHH